MSGKHDNSEEAKALRYTAFGEEALNVHSAQLPRWRALSRAALAYARLVYAGQCLPKKEE